MFSKVNFVFHILLLITNTSFAIELTQNSKNEINRLLNRLETSGCQFNRNGSWYNATEARTHLSRKLSYAIQRNLVGSTDQFIEFYASKSSISGKAYLVNCNGKTEETAEWLSGQLLEMRTHPFE